MTEKEAMEALRLEGAIEITGKAKRCADFFMGLDMAIKALEEIQQYREMDRKLREVYGDCDGLLETAVDGLCKHPGVDIEKPIKARLLIDEAVDKWEAYREIGTVEECREAVEKLPVAEEAIRKLLCSEYGSSCQFCIHDEDEDAACCNVGGSGSWCYKNAKWNGRLE